MQNFKSGEGWEVVKINCYRGFLRIKCYSLFSNIAFLKSPPTDHFKLHLPIFQRSTEFTALIDLTARKMRLLINMTVSACAAHNYLNIGMPVFLEYSVNVFGSAECYEGNLKDFASSASISNWDWHLLFYYIYA